MVRVQLQCLPWPTGTSGSIEELPSGALRVSVYAGTDPLTGGRHYLRETIQAGPHAEGEAQKAMRRLATEVDERRNPRTNATVNQLLDRHFELADLEENTLANYRSLSEKHIRPLIGTVKIEALDGDLFDSFYAILRRCRDHCDKRPCIDHRTDDPHQCDRRCTPHQRRPLSNGSVRYIHFILSGALKRAVRWRWIATNPIAQAAPPPQPIPNPQPPTAEQGARILNQAWQDPDWAMLVWLTMVTGFRRGELCAIALAGVRKAAGHTQESLAAALHVDRSTVIRWEDGDQAPLPYLRPKLARLLGQSPEQLRELIDHNVEAQLGGKRGSVQTIEQGKIAVRSGIDNQRDARVQRPTTRSGRTSTGRLGGDSIMPREVSLR